MQGHCLGVCWFYFSLLGQASRKLTILNHSCGAKYRVPWNGSGRQGEWGPRVRARQKGSKIEAILARAKKVPFTLRTTFKGNLVGGLCNTKKRSIPELFAPNGVFIRALREGLGWTPFFGPKRAYRDLRELHSAKPKGNLPIVNLPRRGIQAGSWTFQTSYRSEKRKVLKKSMFWGPPFLIQT